VDQGREGIIIQFHRKLLVAIDLSDCSISACRQAVLLAERLHSKIEAVFVNESSPAAYVGYQPIILTKSLERKILQDIHARIGPSIPVHICEGRPADEILRVARKRRAGLIVMGTHGGPGHEFGQLGWVAEHVARRSPLPVLTVRRPRKRLRSILVAIDEDERSGRELACAAELAHRLRIPLRVLFISDAAEKQSDSQRLLSAMIRGLPAELRGACTLRPKILQGHVERDLLKAAKRHDLLVIVARREKLFRELLLGSTTDRILQFSPVPVLSLPPSAHRRL
jgi:nucleotide-binding universal stress UspA family protein